MMKKFTNILWGIILGVTVVWLLNVLGFIAPIDNLIYDYLLVSAPALQKPAPSNIIMIQSNSRAKKVDDQLWLVLLDQLEKLHPAQIVFTSMPAGGSSAFYEAANRYGNVVFGVTMVRAQGDELKDTLETWPSNAKGFHFSTGILELPTSLYGVIRSQQNQILIDQLWYPIVEAVAAERVTKNIALEKQGYFRINFSQDVTSFPILRLDDQTILTNLVPELVEGKIVLVGVGESDVPTLDTPLILKHIKITPLQLHAYVLDTLFSGRAIHPLSPGGSFLLIFMAIVFGLLQFAIAPQRYFFLVLLVMMFFYILITWLLLSLANIWLPVTYLCLTQLIIWLVHIYALHNLERQKFKTMLLDLTTTLRHKLIPDYMHNEKDFWARIITIVAKMANVNRLILLERDSEKQRVKVLAQFGCDDHFKLHQTMDDREAPYAQAMTQQQIISINHYFVGAENSMQYMIPLLYLGEVRGFLAFCLQEGDQINLNVESFLNSSGEKIAQFLSIRERRVTQRGITQKILFRLFNFDANRLISREFEHVLALAGRRLNADNDYADNLSIGSIYYDLFGSPLIVNKQMLFILNIEQLTPYKLNLAEFIQSLTGWGAERVRTVIKSLMVDLEPLAFDLTLPKQPDKSYMLRLSPVNNTKKTSTGDHFSHDRQGYLCELDDVTEIKNAYNFKEQIRQHFGFAFRNNIASLIFAASLLEKEDLTEATRKRLHEIIHIKNNKIMSLFEEVDPFLSSKRTLAVFECYPSDIRQIICSVVDSLQDMILNKEASIVNHLPAILNLVYGSPKILEQIVREILRYLLQDAQIASEIIIDVETKDKESVVAFKFSSKGVGMPDEMFQTRLNEPQSNIENTTMMHIKDTMLAVDSWGGKLWGTSEVGVGTSFYLTLRRYL